MNLTNLIKASKIKINNKINNKINSKINSKIIKTQKITHTLNPVFTPSTVFAINNLCINTLNNQRNLATQVSFEVQSGERWVILGANGCGKSSILHVCAGLPLPGRQIHYDFIHLIKNTYTPNTANIKDFANLRSYCPQRLDWSGHLSVSQLISLLNIDASADNHYGLNSLPKLWLSQPISQRSGGEQQRIALSLTLAQQAHLVFLDEPLNHLDEVQQLQHLEILKQSGKTLVMVSHHIKLSLNFSTHVLMPSIIDINGNQQWIAGTCHDIINVDNLAAAYNINTLLAAQLLKGTEYSD